MLELIRVFCTEEIGLSLAVPRLFYPKVYESKHVKAGYLGSVWEEFENVHLDKSAFLAVLNHP